MSTFLSQIRLKNFFNRSTRRTALLLAKINSQTVIYIIYIYIHISPNNLTQWTIIVRDKSAGAQLTEKFPTPPSVLWNLKSHGPCLETDHSLQITPTYFLKIHFNITRLSVFRSSKLSILFKFSDCSPCTSELPRVLNMLPISFILDMITLAKFDRNYKLLTQSTKSSRHSTQSQSLACFPVV